MPKVTPETCQPDTFATADYLYFGPEMDSQGIREEVAEGPLAHVLAVVRASSPDRQADTFISLGERNGADRRSFPVPDFEHIPSPPDASNPAMMVELVEGSKPPSTHVVRTVLQLKQAVEVFLAKPRSEQDRCGICLYPPVEITIAGRSALLGYLNASAIRLLAGVGEFPSN